MSELTTLGGDDPMRTSMRRVIERLGVGEVTSYGEVAAAAGYPGRHRVVGQLLSLSVDSLPWWRVVYNDGRLPPVNPTLQESRLIDEGVALRRMKVVDAPAGKFRQLGTIATD